MPPIGPPTAVPVAAPVAKPPKLKAAFVVSLSVKPSVNPSVNVFFSLGICKKGGTDSELDSVIFIVSKSFFFSFIC